MEIKNVAFASIVIACLAVSYYFIIALPSQNKAKFELEKQKLEMEKQEKQEIKSKESEREMKLLNCRASVETRRNEYLQLNGKPVPGKPGVYHIYGYVQETLDKIERDGNQECTRMYGDNR